MPSASPFCSPAAPRRAAPGCAAWRRLLGAVGVWALTTLAAHAQTGVGIGTTAPDVSAALDIVSATKGALLPRVAAAATLPTPATGLLVYQTGAPAGFYYNAGTPTAPDWQLIATASGAVVTAANGLTRTGQDIQLGGTLTQNTTLSLAGSGLSVVSSVAASGQVSQPVANSTILATVGSLGQSFTLPAGVTVTRIDVYGDGAGTFTLYQGAPGGPVLGTPRPVTYNGAGTVTSVAFSPGIAISAAGTYSFDTGSRGFFASSNVNPYPGGTAYAVPNALAAYDLKFVVHYTVGGLVPTLYASSAAQVGIGTDSPTATLDVAGSTRLRDLTTAGVVTTDGQGNLSSGTGSGSFLLNQSATPQPASFRINGTGSVGGNVDIGGNASIGGNGVVGGLLGVGTTTPNTRLSITPSATEPKITLWDGGSTTNHYGFGISGNQLNYHVDLPASRHVFYAGGKNGDGTELMRIQGNGNVGIGTPTPTQKLEVAGNVQIPAANAYRYAAAKAYSRMLTAADFTPLNSSTTKQSAVYHTFYPGQANGVFEATVQLPQGATLTGIDLFVGDGDANSNVNVKLLSTPYYTNGITQLATYTSVDNFTHYQLVTMPVSGVTIDNTTTSYYLQVTMTSSLSYVALGNVRLNYTVTQAE